MRSSGCWGRPQRAREDGAATTKRLTAANRLATNEASPSTAIRSAALKPPPIRSAFSSLKRRSTAMISKQGDRYLRRILVVGAHAVLKLARQKPEKYPWLTQLLARKPFKVVAVALANKMARIAWALLVKGGPYRARALVAAA